MDILVEYEKWKNANQIVFICQKFEEKLNKKDDDEQEEQRKNIKKSSHAQYSAIMCECFY